MTARQVFYEGRVQGVGFRYTCKTIAHGYDVTGWVRNLPDGRVELQCAGEMDEVDAFLKAISESVLGGHIKKTTVHTVPPLTGVRGFEISS